MSELAIIVENNGGRVKRKHNAIVTNWTLTNAIREEEQKIARIEKAIVEHGENELRKIAIASYKKELEKFLAIDNSPRTVTHTSYISFVLDDNIYYYQVDDNPFFPFYYSKALIKNGKYSKDASLAEDEKEWMFDSFFMIECGEADVKEGANTLYNMLVNAGNTQIIRDSKRQRVPNTYNQGYHMETIYTPERIAEVDF